MNQNGVSPRECLRRYLSGVAFRFSSRFDSLWRFSRFRLHLSNLSRNSNLEHHRRTSIRIKFLASGLRHLGRRRLSAQLQSRCSQCSSSNPSSDSFQGRARAAVPSWRTRVSWRATAAPRSRSKVRPPDGSARPGPGRTETSPPPRVFQLHPGASSG